MLTALVHDLDQLDEPVALVLDDYHLVATDAVHDALAYLLEHLGANLRLAILTRIDPPLPLARLRARGELVEIRAADLRFGLHETATLLNDLLGLNLSGGGRCQPRCAHRGLGHRPAPGRAVAARSLRLRTDRVRQRLQRQPALHPRFPHRRGVRPSNPSPFATSCSAVQYRGVFAARCARRCCRSTVCPPSSGQVQLKSLEHQNLFLTALDSERRCGSLSPVVSGCAQPAVGDPDGPDRVRCLHLRASAWYERAGLVDEATQHALCAHDSACAARLIAEHGCEMIIRGEVATLNKS